MSPRGEGPLPSFPDEAAVHPLWPVVLVLGEIAQRVARRQAEEHEPPTECRPRARDDLD